MSRESDDRRRPEKFPGVLGSEIVLTEMHAIRTEREGKIDTIVDYYLRAVSVSMIDGITGSVVKLAGGCVLISKLDK